MEEKLTPLETLDLLKDFLLKHTENGLDKTFIKGSLDNIENSLEVLNILKDLIILVDDHYATTFATGGGICIKNTQLYKEISKEQFDVLKNILEVVVQE